MQPQPESNPVRADADWQKASAAEFATFLARQFAPPSSVPMAQWWEEHVMVTDGEFPGNYRLDMTPMVRWVAEWLQDPTVKRIVLQGSAQAFKTRALLNFMLWAASENPGTIMWVNATIDAAREFYLKRLEPEIHACDKLNGRFVGRTKDLVAFDSCNLLLRGTNSRVGMQGDPVKWMIFDERREWKPGAVSMLRMRTRTMTEFKEISAGTAGQEGGELDTDFRDGSQTHAHFKCLSCGESQPFRFGRDPSTLYPASRQLGGLVGTNGEGEVAPFGNDWTMQNGTWLWERLRASIRFQCQKCGRLYKNADKHELLRTLHPVDYNPAAPKEIRSLTWNALPFIWRGCDWGLIVEQFIKAIHAAKHKETHDVEPLKTFVTETLGESWRDEIGEISDWGFLESRKENYAFGDPWPEEVERFMGCDRQAKGGEHYWYVVRAFGTEAKSRLVSYGRCNTLQELEEVRKANNVKEGRVLLDTGFKAPECYRWCNATGWKAFKGDDAEFFLSRDMTTGKTFRKCWQKSYVDPFMGMKARRRTMLPLFRFASPTVKDMLAEQMHGTNGQWTLPRKVGSDYLLQMTAERRVERRDSLNRIKYVWQQVREDNHFFDCESQILVAAVIRRLAVGKGDAEPADKSADAE